MAEMQYTYAVARIRSKEMKLLDKQAMEQLLANKTYEECLHFLTDKGWGENGGESAEEMLSIEREKTWELMSELVEDMSVFDTLLYGNDFHNLKAAIKQVYVNAEVPDIYMKNGTIDPEIIYEAVKNHEFSTLPEHMIAPAEEAYQVQLHTGDGQLCDIIIDKATLETIYKKGKESGNPLLAEYAELKTAVSDINIAIRAYKTGKGESFIERSLAECDTLDIGELKGAAIMGLDAICGYLETTVYSEAVEAIKESPSRFERWCDNLVMSHIQSQKYNSFTLSPLIAYILARENEIKSVRILLSGKLNQLSENLIRERLRDMYV